jgi:hypothetical protein
MVPIAIALSDATAGETRPTSMPAALTRLQGFVAFGPGRMVIVDVVIASGNCASTIDVRDPRRLSPFTGMGMESGVRFWREMLASEEEEPPPARASRRRRSSTTCASLAERDDGVDEPFVAKRRCQPSVWWSRLVGGGPLPRPLPSDDGRSKL